MSDFLFFRFSAEIWTRWFNETSELTEKNETRATNMMNGPQRFAIFLFSVLHIQTMNVRVFYPQRCFIRRVSNIEAN